MIASGQSNTSQKSGTSARGAVKKELSVKVQEEEEEGFDDYKWLY